MATMPKPSEALLVDGFDVEQIWAQLEAFDGAVSQRHKRDVSCLGQDISLIPEDIDVALDLLLRQEGPITHQVIACENLSLV